MILNRDFREELRIAAEAMFVPPPLKVNGDWYEDAAVKAKQHEHCITPSLHGHTYGGHVYREFRRMLQKHKGKSN